MKDECLECAKSFAGGEGFNEGSWNKLLVELEDLTVKKLREKNHNKNINISYI